MNNKHKRTQSLAQFIKYSIVGASNTIIDIVILNILSYTTGITHGKTLFLFNLIAFCIYSICGYNLNKKFTFKENKPQNAYFQYASVLFFTMILNSFILVYLTRRNPLIHLMHYHRNIAHLNHLWLNMSMLIGCIILGLLGFLINKFFIFNKKKAL
ncbi:GtrA family protein [Clostridium frigoris]|uniref:GtrA family protein n=1 Tax=Clostridium frigoris TaxID=205327 RepID=A0ABS6BRH9_9CLOT|nr:GtrA family protein [Clostridium frigoris]MBU3159090.1 GtrA family protein [Clostridium frigoris]